MRIFQICSIFPAIFPKFFDTKFGSDAVFPAARTAAMPKISSLKYAYLAYAAKPAADRRLYRAIRKYKPRSFVELGLGNAQRAQNLLGIAVGYSPLEQLRYTGIDLFEARTANNPGITLKLAHKRLKPLAGKVQLAPGDPFMGLARLANSLPNTDMIIISADQDRDALQRAWPYVPRMLHENTLVFQEIGDRNAGATQFARLTRTDIESLAGSSGRGARRAA